MENPKFHNSTSIKPKTSFAPWRARTCTALVVDRGSWIVNSWYGFHRAQWLWSSGFLGFAVLDGVAVLVSPCLMVWYGFCRAQHLVGFWVSPCWLWFGGFLGFIVLNGIVALVSPCSMAWYGFCRARWCHCAQHPWVFGFRCVGYDSIVIWVFWVSPCSVVLG